MPRVTPLPRLLSFVQAETETGISRWTWRDLVARGAISAIRPPGLRRVYLAREDIEQALEKWKERAS